MKDPNENRPGYKKTKVGWIPEEWSAVVFDDLCVRLSEPVSIDPKEKYREIGIRSHGKGIFHKDPVHGIDLGNKSVFWVQSPALVFNIVFAWEQAVAVTGERERGMIASHRFPMYGARRNDVVLDFLYWFFLTKRGKHFLGLASPGGAGRNKTLGQNELWQILIPLPSFQEQKKITKVLSTWNESIEQMRKLVDTNKHRKKAFMQQLLTGKRRLHSFNKPWSKFPLGDLFDERIEVNNHRLPLLAITGSRGVILASEIERKDSSTEDKSRYKRIAPGDIGYNTMRMWQGVSAVSSLEGIVSPAYTVCIPKNSVDTWFMGYLFKFQPIIHLLRRYSQGLVNDTLNLKFPNFAKIRVKIPSLDEQRLIREVLSTADEEIAALSTKLSALEKQKRGLMQKLLTGGIRVTV